MQKLVQRAEWSRQRAELLRHARQAEANRRRGLLRIQTEKPREYEMEFADAEDAGGMYSEEDIPPEQPTQEFTAVQSHAVQALHHAEEKARAFQRRSSSFTGGLS